MDKPTPTSPYKPLGRQLKVLRQRVHETLAEASGAVEIDARELANFELGSVRPTEELLLLLISHFGARDDEAMRLWELAGYNMDKIPSSHMSNDDSLMNLSIPASADTRVLFTDVVDIMVNNYGVVMHFMQGSGPGKPPVAVSRVGMSREHAKSVLQILEQTLRQTEQKAIATPKSTAEGDKTKP